MPRATTVTAPAPLLAYLFATYPAEKKKQIRTWLKYQAVTVNGLPITQFDHPLLPGDTVGIRTDRFAVAQTVVSGGMKIHFEDATLVVIEKPENLLSIASQGESEKTAYFQLTEYLRRGNTRSRDRVWIVHRLDRETSGLMVFAKTPQAKEILQGNWDQAEKIYQAVVEGQLPAAQGTFSTHLNESNPFKVYTSAPSEFTRHAVTHYQVLAQKGGRSLVSLTLETGRRHQLRVQLSEVGCPIIGDEKYGSRTNPARRLGLHACSLRFPHPRTGAEISFTSPLPPALARLF